MNFNKGDRVLWSFTGWTKQIWTITDIKTVQTVSGNIIPKYELDNGKFHAFNHELELVNDV